MSTRNFKSISTSNSFVMNIDVPTKKVPIKFNPKSKPKSKPQKPKLSSSVNSFVDNSAIVIGKNIAQNADKQIAIKAKKDLSNSPPPYNRFLEIISVDMEEYNILHIDSIIKKNLTAKISTLPELERDLNNALDFMSKNKGNAVINTSINNGGPIAEQQLNILRKRIQDLESTFELGYYIHKSTDILDKYKKLISSKDSCSFIRTNSTSATEETFEKNKLVAQYVAIARDYVDIENYKYEAGKLTCPICGPEDMIRDIDDDTLFSCYKCGVEVEILDDTPSFKDTDRVNMSSRYTYTRRGHFIDAMKKYQGKHNIDPDILNVIVKDLKVEMSFHNLDSIRLTKDHLYMFLSEKKLNKHYDDINLLFHIITGKECPEFSHLENLLLEDFEQQEKALDEVVANDINDDRINSINVYYKLCKLLQRRKYPCKKSDFYILKTKTKEDEHDEKLKKAWKILRWSWIDN